jgi:hypothetical protein
MTCNAGFMISGAPQRCVNGALNGAAQTCTASGTILASWSQNYAFGTAFSPSTDVLWYTMPDAGTVSYDYGPTIMAGQSYFAWTSVTSPRQMAIDR